MKTADDGDEIHAVLHRIGIGCRSSFRFAGTIGDRFVDMIVLLFES